MILYTVNEVANTLKLSRSQVYHLCSTGELPCLKIGGSIRFLESDLLAYLESCRRGVPERKSRVKIPRLKLIKLV